MTLRRAIRAEPTESATVMATGSPTGMAETASATATKNTSAGANPRMNSTTAKAATAPTTTIPITRVSRRRRTTNGGVPASNPAIA